MLLEQLTSLNGAAGDEGLVRDFIHTQIKPYVDSITIDNMGNVIAFKKGNRNDTKVMLSAHMDEVALMVTSICDDGTLKFKCVGGIDPRILLGLKVVINEAQINGVIGIKPIHMQKSSERKKPVELEKMYIDIGVNSKQEASELVNLGDYVYFNSDYVEFGDNRVKAKALDDRVGCAILMEVLKERYEFDLYACFTVQEEVGTRGSIITSNRICPDVALVIEATTCSDVHNVEPKDYSTILGDGVALTIMDRTAIVDKGLLNTLKDIAEQNGVKYQYKKTVSGGNDAGSIQRSKCGVRVASISVPCRYIHSPVCVMSKNDYNETLELTKLFLRNFK